VRNNHKLIALSSLGSCFEVFDFFSFIFISSILSTVFFPGVSQGLVYTFIIFATGYFFRPVGGILLAHFGDRYGRKKIFILTLAMMALPSLIIALMPTTQQIGIMAPLLLAFLRILQGISLGGEVAGATTYVAELIPERWRALACSCITSTANIGVLLSTLIISLLTHGLSSEQMLTFGWRIPFLLGAILGLVAVYLRKRLSETPAFLEIKNKKQIEKIPFFYVIKQYRAHGLFGIFLAIVVASSTSTFHLFFPTYLTNFKHYNIQDVILVSSVGIATLAIFSPLFAFASTYFGKKKQCMAGTSILFLLCIAAIFYQYGTQSLKEIYIFIIAVSITIALINSVFMAMLADLFPTRVRFTGVALSYNIGCFIGAGFTPLLNTYLIHATGYLNTPFALVAVCAALGCIVMILSREISPNVSKLSVANSYI